MNTKTYSSLIEKVEQHPKFNDTDRLHRDVALSLYSSSDPDTLLAFLKKEHQRISQSGAEDELTRLFVDNMFHVAQNRKVNTVILSEEIVKVTELTPAKLNNIMNRFREIQSPNLTQFKLLLGILSKNKDRVYMPKLLELLVNSKFLCQELVYKDQVVLGEALRLIKSQKSGSTDLSLNDVWRLAKRLDDLNYNDDNLIELVSYAFNNSKKFKNINTEMQVSQMLAKNNSLNLERATEVLKMIDEKFDTKPKSMFSVACVILSHPKASHEDKAIAQKFIDETLVSMDKQMEDADSRKALKIVCDYLLLPTSEIERHSSRILSFLKDHIEHASQASYIEALRSLPSRRINKNFDIYFPFMKEFASYYHQIANSIKPWMLVEVIEIFASCGMTSPYFYNQVLGSLGRVFKQLKVQELLSIVNSFSRLGFKQTDLLDNIVDELLESENITRLSRGDLESLIRSLYRVGYDSPAIKSKIESLIGDKLQSGNGNL